jgi:hypothetical protein
MMGNSWRLMIWLASPKSTTRAGKPAKIQYLIVNQVHQYSMIEDSG